MSMNDVINDARKKLLFNNFLKQSDGVYIKNDWTVRLFPDFTVDAFNDDYYWNGNIHDINIDDVISDINEFVEGR
jgi:hypothetical protein